MHDHEYLCFAVTSHSGWFWGSAVSNPLMGESLCRPCTQSYSPKWMACRSLHEVASINIASINIHRAKFLQFLSFRDLDWTFRGWSAAKATTSILLNREWTAKFSIMFALGRTDSKPSCMSINTTKPYHFAFTCSISLFPHATVFSYARLKFRHFRGLGPFPSFMANVKILLAEIR